MDKDEQVKMDESENGNRRFDEAGRHILITGMMFTVGLAFAIIAASVQTFDADRSDCSKCIEVLGWFVLLVSGVAGIGWIQFAAPRYIKLGQNQNDQRLNRWSTYCQYTHRLSLLFGLACVALARAIMALSPATLGQ